jgi:putative phosphoribosyl transferase
MEHGLAQGDGDRIVWIPAGRVVLEGRLAIPPDARGIVIVPWLHEPRSQFLVRALGQADLATVTMDLVTAEEAAEDQKQIRHRFDLRLLARRLAEITHWLATMGATDRLPIGQLAHGADAAAALAVAADLPQLVRAVVALSGHPRDAGAALANVGAPALLVVGGHDPDAVAANRDTLAKLLHRRMVVVPSARHAFEEPGALAEVARLATEWFLQYLAPSS